MKLYICEKPSLAEALANTLGVAEKKDGYYDVNGDAVAWLRGHIMELAEPESYDPSYKTWSYNTLPIIPKNWKKEPKYDSIYQTIKSLLERADEIINVGDPDREGQLLVDELLVSLNNKLPTKRLFINAMDEATISRALSQIEDNNSEKNKNMYFAALGRQYTDWMLGINATRKFTLDAGKKIPVGRVKIPVLALVYRRNMTIENFKSIKHYGLTAYYRNNTSLPFPAVWQPKEELLDEEGRLTNIIDVREAEQKILGQPGIVTKCDTLEKTESAPLPYSLSTLQRAAGPKFGFSPSETLELAQKLYEKKLTTYPRSDCNYIPDEQYVDAVTIIDNLKLTGNDSLFNWAQEADKGLRSKAFNTKKTDAHHAIIPTLERVDINTLSENEQKLYVMIAKRYLLQFYPIHTYEETIAEINCADELFIAKGKVIKVIGWKAIEKNPDKENNKIKELPLLNDGDNLIMSSESINEKNTTPPARYTQDTLIGAMSNAHKYVKDASLKDMLKSVKGIGTEATRSTTLDELLKTGMLIEKAGEKSKKELYVSDSAKELIECLPDELTYPDKTALLEIELDKVAKGTLTLESLLQSEATYTAELMKLQSKFTVNHEAQTERRICPVCGKGKLYYHDGKFGKFWSCGEFKNGCTATFPDVKGQPGIFECPVCKKGYLKRVKNKDGDYFWSCSEYKNGCKASFTDNKEQPVVKLCPKCKQGYLKKWHGKKGDYYQCPSCREFYSVNKSGLPELKKAKGAK